MQSLHWRGLQGLRLDSSLRPLPRRGTRSALLLDEAVLEEVDERVRVLPCARVCVCARARLFVRVHGACSAREMQEVT